MAAPIAVDGFTGTTLVIGEDVALTPGVVDIGSDVVLEQADLCSLMIDGLLTLGVTQFEGVFEVEDLVETNSTFGVDAPE